MTRSALSHTARRAWPWLLLLGAACSSNSTQQTGSQTNWLKVCSVDADCENLGCLCGVCSRVCATDADCLDSPEASCVSESDPGAVAVCGGQPPSAAMCLARCNAEECVSGNCLSGVCDAVRSPDLRLTIDTSVRHQSLVGVGASLGYSDEEIAAHPAREALFDALFGESGFDIVRLRNRFEGDNAAQLESAGSILSAAAVRLGRPPTIVISAGSPPATLKANGSRTCAGRPDTCTLITTFDGNFAYAEFAEHWRASLEAYAAAGVVPSYMSIQNNPDWSPPESTPLEACRFLPEEGVDEVMVDDELVTAAYPGYREALAAVQAALSSVGATPEIVAPEVGSLEAVNGYVAQLDPTTYDAMGFHLYYTIDPAAVDVAPFREVRDLAQASGRPAFQTEMRADGLATAVLMHYSLTEADAAVYLQNDFVVSSTREDGDPAALIALTSIGFESQGPYHSLRHFARDTDPGWTRVATETKTETETETTATLASAWLAPDGEALTVVLLNPWRTPVTVAIEFDADIASELTTTVVTRTVFSGVERSVDLGVLGADNVVSLPSESIVTVALRR